MNRRVDIREDIKCYQDTLSYASSKVDYSIGENIYMLPSDMNLKIKTGTVGYNNKILVSNEKFSLGKNVEVNIPGMKSTHIADSNEVLPLRPGLRTPLRRTHAPNISHKNQEPETMTHNDEKIALVLALANSSAIWNMFRSIP